MVLQPRLTASLITIHSLWLLLNAFKTRESFILIHNDTVSRAQMKGAGAFGCRRGNARRLFGVQGCVAVSVYGR